MRRIAALLLLRSCLVLAQPYDLLIIGGSTPTGASDAIYRFNSGTGRVTRIGRLPRPLRSGSRDSSMTGSLGWR